MFDVEIALIFPIIYLFKTFNFFIWMKTSIFLIIILLEGVYREWNQNM